MPVAASAATVSVRITDHLSPAELAVPAGATIRFVNADDERHRMRSQSGPAEFDSHNLEPGQSYSMKLTARGTYTYLDERDDDDTRYHGRIVVGGSSGSATKPSSGGGSSGGGSTSATPSSASVSTAGRAFSPATATIAAGGSVTFRNDDDRAHTVTANDGGFNSGTIAEGGSWKRTFKQAGTFSYLCAIHPEMTGKVVVKGATPAAAAKPSPSPTPTPAAKPAATVTGAEAEIRDFSFAPSKISVPVSSTVTWRNAGEAPHTVTAENGSFDSEMISAGGSWARTFETAGTFAYVCAFHPQMRGVVEVTSDEVAAAPPAPPAGQGTPDPSPSPSPSASLAPAAIAPAATQPPPPVEPDAAAVSTPGPTFGGELMARFVIVGVLIGGAFLLFVRAVGGSVRREERAG